LGGELYGGDSYERRTPIAFSIEDNIATGFLENAATRAARRKTRENMLKREG
jgi:hypothetical protein